VAGIHLITSRQGSYFQRRKWASSHEIFFEYHLKNYFADVLCGYKGRSIRNDAECKDSEGFHDEILYDSDRIDKTKDYLLIEFAANLMIGTKGEKRGADSAQATNYQHLDRFASVNDSLLQIEFPSKKRHERPILLNAECSKMWFLYFFRDYETVAEMKDIIEGDA
jgi:hypothetical protein